MSTTRAARPVAVLDIGTNSVKLLVATTAAGRVRTVYFERITTRLGAGLDESGRITDAAAARTTRAVRSLAATARRHGAARIIAVGTYALRAATNGADVARRIGRAAGSDVTVLDGREEARLSFLSARSRLGHPRPVTFLMDIGGGSAQFVAARGTAIIAAQSLPLGALRLTERHLRHDPIHPAEYQNMRREIDRAVSRVTAPFARLAPRAAFVAVGGSATTALAMARGSTRTRRDGKLRLSDLRRLEHACLTRTIAQRRLLPGLPPDRADIIPAGIAVMLACMTVWRKRVVHVTGGGVREGAILAMETRD